MMGNNRKKQKQIYTPPRQSQQGPGPPTVCVRIKESQILSATC